MSVSQWATEARAAAANPEHPWDVRALEWALTPDSVVVEVGGYKGRWALQIAERSGARVYVFEPQAWAAETCRAVLGDRATVEPYALGTEDGEMALGAFGTDGASLLKPGADMVPVREAGAVLAPLGPIALMLVNIEGYEATLVPHMLARGIRPRVLMVQLHGDAEAPVVQALKAARYRRVWTYGLTLQAWEVR